MGILDDAIREHLELKRKHGAAEDELERQEEEALGPARREVAPAQTQDGNGAGEPTAAELSADGESAPDAQVDASSAEPSEAEAVVEAPIESVPELEPAPDPETQLLPEPEPIAPEPDPDRAAISEASEPPAHEEPAAEEEPAADEPPVAAGDTPPRGFEPVDQEDEDGEDGEDGEGGDEGDGGDVLHDTPDFLQETPEHDRLWFEQKPPRDFDFD
jgi:hypothetical protein